MEKSYKRSLKMCQGYLQRYQGSRYCVIEQENKTRKTPLQELITHLLNMSWPFSQPANSHSPATAPSCPQRDYFCFTTPSEAKLHKHPSNFHSLVKTKSSSQWPPNRGCAKQMHKQRIALAIQGLRSWQAHVHTGESSRRGGVWGRMVMGGYTCNRWWVATV